MPTVSVIMNGLNCEAYLKEAIDSVFAQTFTDWEIIFWDNCSTDQSAQIAKGYDDRVHYFCSDKTIPLGHARNLAITKARGQYIAFLDCDDLWLPEKLEKQVERFESNPAVDIVFTDTIYFSEEGTVGRCFLKDKPPQGHVFKDLVVRNFLPMPAVAVRRSSLDRIEGWFDERFNLIEDADLFTRIAYVGLVDYIDAPLTKRRMHKNSSTSKYKELFPKEEEMMLDKFAALWPSFEKDCAKEILLRRELIQFQYAMMEWEQGNASAARRRWKPYLSLIKRRRIPYLFSYLPYSFYRYLKHSYKVLMSPLTGGFDDQTF